MFKASKALGFAALVIMASAIIHIATPLVAGFSEETFWLVPVALIIAIMGYLLIPNRRFMAWITFYVMIAAGIAALGLSAAPGTIPEWWWMLIIAADWFAAALLFVYLWKPKPVISKS